MRNCVYSSLRSFRWFSNHKKTNPAIQFRPNVATDAVQPIDASSESLPVRPNKFPTSLTPSRPIDSDVAARAMQIIWIAATTLPAWPTHTASTALCAACRYFYWCITRVTDWCSYYHTTAHATNLCCYWYWKIEITCGVWTKYLFKC